MNEPEMNPSTPDHLSDQVAALQRQVFTLLLALIVISGTVVFYLYYQSRVMGGDLTAIRPQAVKIIQAYNQNRQGMENFRTQLSNYAVTHPDFQPVLRKYGWAPPVTAPKK